MTPNPNDFYGQRPRIVHGRAVELRLPAEERVRASRRLPQAVVKVTSYCKGLCQTRKHVSYISRKGELPLEKDGGEKIEGLENQQEILTDWSKDFEDRKNGRDTANIVFTMPPGSSPENPPEYLWRHPESVMPR